MTPQTPTHAAMLAAMLESTNRDIDNHLADRDEYMENPHRLDVLLQQRELFERALRKLDRGDARTH
jgi:hypothetical protein